MGKLDLNFQDEQGSNLSKFEFIKDDGSSEIGKLIRRANVTQRGTPLNSENMNKIVSAINSNYDYSHNALYELGAYDTYVYNDDGTITITRQTGYLTINSEDITSGTTTSVNNENAYTYTYSNKNISDALYEWVAIIGVADIGFSVKVADHTWTIQNSISINSVSKQITIGFDSIKTQAEIQELCPISIQYKLATATTEKVEPSHYARYNKRFILDNNKDEAEKSANLWSYEKSITINAGSEQWWTLSNATMVAWGLVIGEKYSIKAFTDDSTKDLSFQILPSYSDFKNGGTFIFTSSTQIRLGGNTVSSTVTFTPKITLVKGSDILHEYQPYYGKPVHKKEFENFKNSMQFIPYVSFVESSSSESISENGTYFVIPTDPSNASLKLEVKAGPHGTLQTAYFSGGIISVYRNYNSKFQICEVKITYGVGSSAASTYISDSYSPATSSNGMISRITGKCKIYKLI